MRPIRLELEGFTAYRELTVCDFEGVDLFVLTGPTGSGKSSIIDALTFALYGSVSRYGNPNLVHPVISQGKLEAKVRFDFSVEGRKYTAVRIVRRTRGGATTREARLESDGLGPALSARRGISLDRASSRRAGRDSFPHERSVGLARGPGPISSPVSRGVRDAPFGGARDTRSRKRPSGISLSWGRRANLAP